MKVKKLTVIVALIAVFTLSVLTLFPTVTAVSDGKASITVELFKYGEKKPMVGTSFRLYMIAEYLETDGEKYEYKYIQPFDNANVDIKNPDYSVVLHLAHFATSNSLPYTEKSIDETGTLVFDNLAAGLYLIVPSNNTNVSSSVISVTPDDAANGKNIMVISKNSGDNGNEDDKDTYISVVKKWDTNKSHPESVTVVLLRDGQEFERVELNAENNWHYRWDNLSKDYIWNVVEVDVPEGYTVYYETSSNTVTIINKSESGDSPTKPSEPDDDKLVQTGQLNWPVPVCAMAGLVFFSVGWAVLNFSKKENQ